MAATADPITTRVVIKRMGANCPKPDGWFTCIAKMRGEYNTVRLTGKTDIPLTENMKLDVVVRESSRPGSYGMGYEVIEMKVVTDSTQNTIAYLSSFPGIGKTTATKIAEAWGSDSVEMLKRDPDAVAQQAGISKKTAANLSRLVSQPSAVNEIRQMLPEVRSAQMVKRIKETIGTPDALRALLDRDPYELHQRIPGLSFRIVDQVALRLLNGDALCPYRVNHGLVHILETRTTNDLYVDLSDQKQLNSLQWELESLLSVRFSMSNELVMRIQALAAVDGSPVVLQSEGKSLRLYLRSTLSDIRTVVSTVRTVMLVPSPAIGSTMVRHAISSYEAATGLRLTDEQRAAVSNAATERFSVITGGPGRGKTTIVDCIAGVMSKGFVNSRTGTVVSREVVLLAPTGRAMAKLQSATGKKYPAMTIDKFIVSAEAVFRNKRNVTDFKSRMARTMFIVDETSMVDLAKMAALLRYSEGARYCFIGDTDQLPPIGRGRVFKDIIDSGAVPVTRLTTPLRNGGKILANADRIMSGDANIQWDLNEMPFYPQQEDNEAMMDAILDTYMEERDASPDPNEVALLAPMKKGPVGVGRLNIRIQDLVCPETQAAPSIDAKRCTEVYSQRGYAIQSARYYAPDGSSTRFRIGDMVMNTKNNYEVELVRYTNDDFWNGTAVERQVGIFNGDVGRIIGYFPRMATERNGDCEYVVVQLSNGLVAQLNLTMGDFEDFDLAYAMTVHKAQGCEYLTVIFVSPNAMVNMVSTGFANRNILYTAVTRAKRKVVVIGSKDSVGACIHSGLPRYNSDMAWRLAGLNGLARPVS